MRRAKKTPGCLTRIFQFFFIFIVLAVLFGVGSDGNETTTSSGGTIRPTATVKATQKPTTAPTVEPTEEPFTIRLVSPNLGEYGKYYTFNENVAKAEESDKETIIQCFVPAGTYTATNESTHFRYIHIYSAETVYNEDGWEEPKYTWVSPKLDVGASCEITVEEGFYINLQEKDVFKLVRK
jgi:hypothetical protein